MASRGLTAPSIAEDVSKLRLGFVDDPLPGHDRYRGMLAIPYLRASPGHGWSVVSIRFRCIESHEHTGHGKYNTVAGDGVWLYNTNALLRDVPVVAITEGEIDAITASVCGTPAVGVPGANQWQPYMRELFLGYETVFILADGDDAGSKFANAVAKTLPNSRVIPMPAGHDVNSLVVERGKRALLERMK